MSISQARDKCNFSDGLYSLERQFSRNAKTMLQRDEIGMTSARILLSGTASVIERYFAEYCD